MDELRQEVTLIEKWQDVREGINDAAMELVSALDDIIEEIEGTDKTPSISNLNGIDDPAGMLQMYLEQLYELHQETKTPKLQIVRNTSVT